MIQAFVRFALAVAAVAAWCLWRGAALGNGCEPAVTRAKRQTRLAFRPDPLTPTCLELGGIFLFAQLVLPGR